MEILVDITNNYNRRVLIEKEDQKTFFCRLKSVYINRQEIQNN